MASRSSRIFPRRSTGAGWRSCIAWPVREERGFAFFPYRTLTLGDRRNQKHYDTWDLAEYGLAFVLEKYVRREWATLFEVVQVREAPDGWQDYIVLRKPHGGDSRTPSLS